MKKLIWLVAVSTVVAVLAGCQSSSQMSASDEANFRPKPITAVDMNQKSAQIAERMKAYQKLHPPVGMPATPAAQ